MVSGWVIGAGLRGACICMCVCVCASPLAPSSSLTFPPLHASLPYHVLAACWGRGLLPLSTLGASVPAASK